MTQNKKSLTEKILEWAKEYGKHFCLHDLQGFFSNEKFGSISSIVSDLANKGKLIKAGSSSSCKMQTKMHSSWIYNDALKEEKATRKRRARYGSKTHLTSVKLVRPERMAKCPYCYRKVAILELRKK